MASYSDPIAQLLTHIRNAVAAEHKFCDIDLSQERLSIVQILKENGFISNYSIGNKKKKLRIFLKYRKDRRPVIRGLKRVSKPGVRKYVGYLDIRSVFGGIGISILSTSKGILDNKRALENKVGGELLCEVW